MRGRGVPDRLPASCTPAAAIPCLLCAVMVAVFGLGCCPNPIPAPSFDGPYQVQVSRIPFDDGSEFTLYSPVPQNASERFPVVILSGGWNLTRVSYEDTARIVAGWGYITIIRFYPTMGIWSIGPVMTDVHIAQIGRLIDWCAAENARPGSPLLGIVDAEHVGLIGHSFGGVVTLATAAVDDRIDAAVALDTTRGNPATNFDDIGDISASRAAIMYIRASDGGYCSGDWPGLESLFDYTRPPAIEVTINGAGHMDFIERIVDPGIFGYALCPAGSLDPEEVRSVARRYLISWFNVHLKGQQEYEVYYNGPSSEQDEGDGMVRIRRNPIAHK